MKTPSPLSSAPYLLLFLFIPVMADPSYTCNQHKMHALYYATRCCEMTQPSANKEFQDCHAKFLKMSGKSNEKLTSPERIAINICAHECSLRKKKFLKEDNPQVFDNDAIEDYYKRKYGKKVDFSTYMEAIFDKCIQFDSTGQVNIKYPKVDFIEQDCDPLAARIMMCIQIRAMQTCPKSAFDTNTLDCMASKVYFQECVGSIEKVLRNL